MASLLSLGNPLSSARGEPRALGHLAQSREEPGFAGCQRLTFLGDAKRAAVPRSPERNPTWMWTLILSLSWLAQSSLQAAYRISLAYSGPTLAFNENFGGDIFEGALDNYFVFNNYNPAVLLGPCKLRIYSSSGNELTSIYAGPSNSEGPTFPQPNKAVILGQTTGIYVFTVSELAGSVSLTLDTSLSATSLNHLAYFASSVSEPSSSVIFATYWQPLSSTARFYKIGLNDVDEYESYTLPGGYGMSEVCTLAFGPGDTIMGMGNGKLVFVSKVDLQFVKIFSNPDLGYFVLTEPTDQTVAYAGSKTGLSESLSKIDTSSLTWELLVPPMSVSAFVVNLVRIPIFRVGLFTEAFLATIRLFDIDSMAVLASQNVGGSLSRVSLTYGKTIGKSFFSGIVNPASTNLQIYNLTLDFCTIAWQNPCLACEAGRYLSGNSLENKCLKPSEFPQGYGIQGQIIVPCQTGCLKCTADASVCTLCDDTNGYYLYPATSGCLLVNQIPDTFGLDKTTTPFLISSCTEPQCRRCRSDREICDACLDNYYLLEPTDGTCRQNNTVGFGSIIIAGVGRLTSCSSAGCSDCKSDYSVCSACLANWFQRANEGAICYDNTQDGYGIDQSTNPNLLTRCIDPNCKTCHQDHRYCIGCESPYYRLANTCVLGSPRMGPDNSNTLQYCSVANCMNCGNHFDQCQECDTGFYRPQNSQSACISNDQPGIGLDLTVNPHDLATCQVLNCQICFSNIRSCELCESGFYSTSQSRYDCVQNTIQGKGIGWLNNKQLLLDCTDPHCNSCYTSNTHCELCDPGFYLLDTPETPTAPKTCVRNVLAGFGLDTNTNISISTCLHPNCADCFTDRRICRKCVPHTFMTDFAPGCFANTGIGFGTKWVGEIQLLSLCAVDGCEVCRTDAASCMSCKLPEVLHPVSRTCVENNVPGMGKWTDINNLTILRNCTYPGCQNCSANVENCESCFDTSKFVDPVSKTCTEKSQKDTLYQLKAIQPSYYNGKLKSFAVQFTEPLLPVATDLNELLQFNLVRQSGQEYPSSEYSVKVAVTARGELSGEFSALGFIEESTLTMTQKNKSQILFRSSSGIFSPDGSIEIEAVSNAPLPAGAVAAGEAAQQVLAGVSAASFVTILTSGTGGGQLATLFSVIEYIEYVLYVDGQRVLRGDNFLYFFSFDPLQLIPNWLAPNEEGVRCDPGPNFARGQMKCDFLSQCGAHIQMIAIAGTGILLFCWAVPIGINKLKSPKAKTVLQAVNYIPSHFFSPSLLLTFVEGPQIDIIRSALLNLLIYPTHRTQTNLLGLIVSLLAIGLYGLYAFKLARIAWDLRSQPPGAQILPSNQFFREPFERINLPKSSCEQTNRAQLLRLLAPSIVIINNAIIQGLIVMLAGHGLIQIYMVLLMQVASLGLWTLVRPYKLLTDNLQMMIVAAAKLCISICLIIVNTKSFNINFEEREKYFGLLLIVLYSACILSVLLTIVVDSIIRFWGWVTTKKANIGQNPKLAIKVKLKNAILPGTNINVLLDTNQYAKPNLQINSLKNIAPISSMKRGFVSSQKMIKIKIPKGSSNSSSKLMVSGPKLATRLNNVPNVSFSWSELNSQDRRQRIFDSPSRREETDEQNSTTRSVKDPKASFVSISSKTRLNLQENRSKLTSLQGSTEINRQLQINAKPRDSFRQLPPIQRPKRTIVTNLEGMFRNSLEASKK